MNAAQSLSIVVSMACLMIAVVSVSVHADEPGPKGEYSLKSVKVVAVNRTKTPEGKTVDKISNKLTHSIRFDVFPKFEKVKGSEKKAFKVLDPVTEMSLKLDKAIAINGKAIPAGTNLLKYKKFDGKSFNVSMNKLHPLSIGSVRIKRDFEIPNDVYNVTFGWKTKSGKTLSQEVQVTIDVELP